MKNEQQEPIVIDLEELKQRDDLLQESWLRMFGGFLKGVLNRLFGGSDVPVRVKGKKRDVKNFARAVKGERDYMHSLRTHGLDDPKTYDSKYKLNRAVEKFEKETGLKWPFS